MDFTVENVCGFLVRSKLFAADDVKALYVRWQAEAREQVGDLTRFARWLVANQYVTEYQAALLLRGKPDFFFLNQYKILDRLAQGRMAGVYRAVHQLGQVVAIKVLPPSKNRDPQFFPRFQREVKLALKLKHPNVVRSFQVGTCGALHYLVMEYLEGETLAAVLQRRQRLPAHEAVRLIGQALQGLEHIHEQGLIHRDLKPANLMLVPAAAPGRDETTLQATLKILDIGLGRALLGEGEQSAEELHLTGEGMLLGTPDYLAPEQARDPRTVDIRADIYSLGCVLYHCLTGQPPFPDTNVFLQVVRHTTEPPRPLRELVPDVTETLQQIVNGMLAKDPNRRYPTPEHAARALRAFQTVGGAPSLLSEEGPKLRQYLSWLEMDDQEKEKRPRTSVPSTRLPTSGEAKLPPAAPARAAQQAVPAGVATAQKPQVAKKQKPKSDPSPLPSSPTPAPLPVRPSDLDVELIPAPAVPIPAVPLGSAKKGFRLCNRDWLMLGVGALGTLVAGVVGFLLEYLFR